MENNFDRGRALFQQHERAKQDRDEREQKLKDRSSWTKTEISHWLDDYLVSLRKKLGTGLHINCDKYEKSILVMGPFPIGLDINVVTYSLLQEDDIELTQSVLESIEFRITFPSTATLGVRRKNNRNEYFSTEYSLRNDMRDFILNNIKGSKRSADVNYSYFELRGASNLELVLGFFSVVCESYLEESAKKSPPWITFMEKNQGRIESGAKLIGSIMILFIVGRVTGIL